MKILIALILKWNLVLDVILFLAALRPDPHGDLCDKHARPQGPPRGAVSPLTRSSLVPPYPGTLLGGHCCPGLHWSAEGKRQDTLCGAYVFT